MDTQEPPKLEMGMVLFPNFTMLDLVGPQTMLAFASNPHFISHSLEPVGADTGGALLPSTTFADAPRDFDILFVPGGSGTAAAMENPEIIDFLTDCGQRAKYITSVCTGSLVLAAAGLLDGYRAACHWAWYPALDLFPAVQSVRERVVIDRNRITGGGVTAGVDFGLTLLAHLRGEGYAQLTQLMTEYNPAPPFNVGHPDLAGPELTAMATQFLSPGVSEHVAVARKING